MFVGGRVADDIVAWLNKKTGPPAKSLDSVDDAKAFVDANQVVVVGFFKVSDISDLFILRAHISFTVFLICYS